MSVAVGALLPSSARAITARAHNTRMLIVLGWSLPGVTLAAGSGRYFTMDSLPLLDASPRPPMRLAGFLSSALPSAETQTFEAPGPKKRRSCDELRVQLKALKEVTTLQVAAEEALEQKDLAVELPQWREQARRPPRCTGTPLCARSVLSPVC
jgi:hypothetical protein